MNAINLKQYPNFLTQDHCKAIISLGEPKLEKAGILGEQYENFRVSETTFFKSEIKALKKIREAVAIKTGVPIENQESMSIIKYQKNMINKKFKTPLIA